MNSSKELNYTQKFIEMCRHPVIQALQPTTENTEGIWLPTSEQLHEILKHKLPYPERSSCHYTSDEWVYETYFREWAADYGTYIDTYRQFVAEGEEVVLLEVLLAILGVDGRWMV